MNNGKKKQGYQLGEILMFEDYPGFMLTFAEVIEHENVLYIKGLLGETGSPVLKASSVPYRKRNIYRSDKFGKEGLEALCKAEGVDRHRQAWVNICKVLSDEVIILPARS